MLGARRTTRLSITPEDFALLARPAVGLPVPHSWRGAGSAIFLEFGRLLPRPSHQREPAQERTRNPRGEAGIMIEWSWRIERARSIEAGSWSSERRIDSAVARVRGSRVMDVSVTGRLPELIVGLSDGQWVHSFMTAEGQPKWAMFLPDASWLTVERGGLVHDISNRRQGRTHRGGR